MNIATITCHDTGTYGASLQAYALSRYLRDCGHNVEVIDYHGSAPLHPAVAEALPPSPQPSLMQRLADSRVMKPLADMASRRRYSFMEERNRRFNQFRQFLPLSFPYRSIEELRDNPPEADLYIAGSDRIWNLNSVRGNDPAYYLDFGPRSTRRASYAASFASSSLPRGTEPVTAERLLNLDGISVRESSGLQILDSLGLSGEQSVDPVFLLDREEWNDMADMSEIRPEGQYVLLYTFDASPLIMRTALRIRQLTGLPVISISPRKLRGVDRNIPDAGPLEFLAFVRRAALVLTESFHALAFCMIYRSPFFAFRRKENINARLTDFLSLTGFERYLISRDEPRLYPLDFSFDEPVERIERLTRQSKAYLERLTK